MPHQLALNVIARIRSGEVGTLDAVLGTIKERAGSPAEIPFAELRGVHFARFVIFDAVDGRDGKPFPAQLALLTNYDAPEDSHIEDLATVCGDALDAVFGLCDDYPPERPVSPARRAQFLRAHRQATTAFYVNRQGRSVAQIRSEEKLRIAIDGHLDRADHAGRSPREIHRGIVEFVASREDLRWALEPAEPPSFAWRLEEALHRFSLAALALVLSPVLLLAVPVFLVVLRHHERGDLPDTSAASAQSIRDFRDDEDFGPQNQIIAVGAFKRGLFRRLTSTLILGLTDYASRHIYNTGVLSGLNTIHFARWVYLDGRRRLFFSSNYDGSLESYMNDFIDKAAWGLNAIFSSGDGFPRTRFLFCGGITDEKAYKRFLPTRQVHSRAWYSAYPNLTTKNIANHAAIRSGLSRRMSEREVQGWLRRLGVGNELPPAGLITRALDGVRWERICRLCR